MAQSQPRASVTAFPTRSNYKWVALPNTTVGVLLATIDSSIMHTAFAFAICACLVAGLASWSRGRRYVNEERTRTRPHMAGVAEREVAGQ